MISIAVSDVLLRCYHFRLALPRRNLSKYWL